MNILSLLSIGISILEFVCDLELGAWNLKQVFFNGPLEFFDYLHCPQEKASYKDYGCAGRKLDVI